MTRSPVSALADRLVAITIEHLEAAVAGPLAGWRVPRVFGGHAVAADVRADLIYALGLLADAGVTEVAGNPIDSTIAALLSEVDGAGTNTFFSYRIAETLGRWGPFDANPLLAGFGAGAIGQVATACDSTDWIELLDAGALPRNYAAVLARCEVGRERLGLAVDEAQVASLVERARALLATPSRHHDDSEDGAGHRYDIYTADLALFSSPLADRLGDDWRPFTAAALGLVEQVAAPSGAAVSWGRSTGILSTCLTIELGALVLADPGDAFGRDRNRWLALATGAAAHLDGWFDGGVISAHQRRSPYSYRGPARRLQMTFDVLGKLAWSAGRLRRAAAGTSPAAAVDPFDDLDELVRFDDRAGVWTHRSHGLVVAVPFVGPTRSDYQPAPRNPGTFEVPVDRALVTWVPAVHRREQVACGGGVPVSLVPVADGVHARWEGFPQAGGLGADTAVAGRREATTTVRGRTLRIEEHLVLGDGTGDPGVTFVSVTVPEAEGRPLRVDWECEHPHATREVDVSGIAEWRSFWGELPRVHELEVPVPADGEVRYAYEVTPLWRVASESLHHHYHQSLYGPMAGRVEQHHFASHHMANPAGALARLGPVDLFHLHWPEWFTGPDVAAMARFLDLLDEADVRLVWTQHNLRPHREDEAFEELYGLVASRAHGVIHHSAWGRDRALAGYRYRDDATHVVIPHGNFANLLGAADPGARAAAEAELGLPPLPAGGLRIGVVGAPRRAKRTVELMEAFTEVDRDDLQLLVLSLAEGEAAPDDPRLVALPYEYVDRDVYNRRLAAIDVVALPFDPEGDMITTGVVADVIGWGMPAVASSWGYLTESLGAAALPLGDTVDEMADALESLTPEAVADAAVAVAGLAESTSWERVAAATLELFEAVGTAKR